ncbi:MAG: hypothetical protein RLZZ301_1127 [Bacteroidota bacterium]|jgi:transcriptional regulator with XRE-family HTH domain
MFIASNLKLLRKRASKSQEEMAQLLGLNRSTYSGYENEVAQPSLEVLLAIAEYHHIRLEQLLKEDMQAYAASDWEKLQNGWQQAASGQQLRVLASVVNTENEEEIELIPEKVKAGYTTGYADPEFVRELPTLRLPFLSKDRKYRAFPISGDSMPPVIHGSYVVAEFVQDWMHIPSNTPCIVVTQEEGIVFKYVFNQLKEAQQLLLVSSNPLYDPYTVHVSEILEIWRFVSYISKEIPEVQLDAAALGSSMRKLQQEVQQLVAQLQGKASR